MRYDRRGFRIEVATRSDTSQPISSVVTGFVDAASNRAFINGKNAIDLKLYALFLRLGLRTAGSSSRTLTLFITVEQATQLIKRSRAGPIAGRSD